MGLRNTLTVLLSLLFALIVSSALAHGHDAELDRRRFPTGFVFGVSSAAYQVEGAANEGGRGPSIWDNFTHSHPERIKDGSNGDVAADQYHRYKVMNLDSVNFANEDVSIMEDIGFDAYRFSISWPRILPNGSTSGGINKEGVAYYNKLIDELLCKGLKPFVTLFHWDSPQGLEDQYGGFLSSHIVEDFLDFAEVCFREFGDRVKHWITFNEPYAFSRYGYALGMTAPGRCSPWDGNCSLGDSGTEPYIVTHHELLAHAAAVDLYKHQFQEAQKGKIGITLDCNWLVPYSNTKSDSDAVQRALDFVFGWFMDPLTHGDYPFMMRVLAGNRLPKFTEEQSKLIKGSFDFIGLNYYSASYVESVPIHNTVNKSFNTDSYTNQTAIRNGIPIGSKPFVYPEGLHDLLLYTKSKYNNPVIYITENGWGNIDNGTLALEDEARIDYYQQHLHHVRRAIREGVDVRGFFAWTLLDHFEWINGYELKFGICHVDYKDGLRRIPKSSALWFKKLLTTGRSKGQ